MSHKTATRIVDFMFRSTPSGEKIDIGFFGGEPLLEFDLLKHIVDLVISHPLYDKKRVLFSIVTNGTIFSGDIATYLKKRNITLGISCDGPPHVQDSSRIFADGSGSSAIVEANIRKALNFFPFMPVNAVYKPETLHFLPDVVDYFSGLGVRNIYLNHDITAQWTKNEADMLPALYDSIGKKYTDFYRTGNAHHISLIDSKIVVMLRGGYQPLEKCRMSKGELAFATSGNIYPCERLIGKDEGTDHCLGNISLSGSLSKQCTHDAEHIANEACRTCSLRDYCMNWCGCTNYFATGDYNTAGPFICASEKAAIQTAYDIIAQLDREGFAFSEHLAGTPLLSILNEASQLSNKECC